MSEPGFFLVGDDKPPVFVPMSEWARFDDGRSPFSRREAYMWTALFGPVVAQFRPLARQWRWETSKVRRFVHTMTGCGLFKFDGQTIIAVDREIAAPAPIEGNWPSLRAAVFARDGYRCTYCGSGEQLQCDHVHPRAKGGTDIMSNLTTACRPCNASKRDRLLSEWRQ